MPYSDAERYAKDSLQLSQYKLGTENISIVNDRLHWTFPLKPDGLIITFTKQNRGVVAVDATTQARNTTHFMVDLAIGEGMQLRDNLHWNIWKNRYFVDTDDPFYIITDNGEEILTVVGAINYSFHFRWGVFYTVPNFAGVFVIDSAGKIEFLSPEEALERPDLAGNRIFPENLARIYVDAYQYHLGLANKLFIHEDQIKIQDAPNVDSTVNKQPYLMETVEGLKWFISAEPYGASHGIFKLFLVDARTGEIEIYELPPTETLTGPVRAIDYVRRANPVVSWDRFDSVEPLPFIRDQVLYWKLTVIPTDAAGIAYQVFINSETNDIVELTSDEEVIAFLHGKYEEKVRQSEELKSDDEIIASIKAKIRELEELLEQLGN